MEGKCCQAHQQRTSFRAHALSVAGAECRGDGEEGYKKDPLYDCTLG